MRVIQGGHERYRAHGDHGPGVGGPGGDRVGGEPAAAAASTAPTTSPAAAAGSPPAAPAPGHQQGPPQVKLFLHGQGPKVLQRAGRLVLGQVVDRPADERPVFGVQGAGGHVGGGGGPGGRWHPQVGRDADGDQGQAGGRQQAPGPAGVKGGQVDPARGRHLPQQVARDEVAGDDEKDVDADVSAREVGRPNMEADDQEDGDGAQGLDVGAEGGGHDGW